MSKISGFSGFYRFLSNFWPCEITYEGLTYASTEAAYQASKTTSQTLRQPFTNWEPGVAKREGRKVPLREDWSDELKTRIMTELNELKFSDPKLMSMLQETGSLELEETNTWHDNFYGNCTCKKCANIPGQNVLGKILMQIRDNRRRVVVPHVEFFRDHDGDWTKMYVNGELWQEGHSFHVADVLDLFHEMGLIEHDYYDRDSEEISKNGEPIKEEDRPEWLKKFLEEFPSEDMW